MEGMTNLTNGSGAIVTGGNGNSNVTTVANNGVDNGSQNGSTGSGRSTPSSSDSSPGKLFVGGLSWQTTPDKLRDYFGQFGTVTDVLVMKDPVTQVDILLLSWHLFLVSKISSPPQLDTLHYVTLHNVP